MKRTLTEDEIDLLLSFVREQLPFAEEMVLGYGPYYGGDPHNFTPDPECTQTNNVSGTVRRARPGNEASDEL